MVELGQITDELLLAKLLRDARLWHAVLAVQISQSALEADPRHQRQTEESLWRRLGISRILFSCSVRHYVLQVPRDVTLWRVEVATPDFEARRLAWKKAFDREANESDTVRLADAFQFGPLRIQQAVNLASGFAAFRDPANPQPGTGDFLDAGQR